jgi:N-acetylmuramoyl-L-alanine amidase
MSTPKIGLCVGHSRQTNGHPEGGAVSVGRIQEWKFNRELALLISAELTRQGIASVIVDHYEGGSYGAAQAWLGGHLAAQGVTVALELHFNSSDSIAATGHEWLYWHTSAAGKRLAVSLNAEMRLALPDLKARGAKPLAATDRGAGFLQQTRCPAVICEPFFGSNPSDWALAVGYKPTIARVIADGVSEFLTSF